MPDRYSSGRPGIAWQTNGNPTPQQRQVNPLVEHRHFAETPPPLALPLDDLKSMFITHLHTDHIVDYYSFFLSGGYTAAKGKAAVTVYGPGPAGGLPPSEVGQANPATVTRRDRQALQRQGDGRT